MRTIGKKRLKDAERGRIEEILLPLRDRGGMNFEMIDGFFAALVCGPELVMPSEYMPVIFGDETDEAVFQDEEEANLFLNLLMRHWNSIADQLHSKQVFVPFLAKDEQGIERANDWAKGFLRGTMLRKESWIKLLDDKDNDGLLLPMFALANEHNPDPKLRPYKDPMTLERRDQLIAGLVGSVMMIYSYFESDRRKVNRAARQSDNDTYRRNGQNRSKRSLLLWLRQEIQKVLRQHHTAVAQKTFPQAVASMQMGRFTPQYAYAPSRRDESGRG